MSAQSPIIPAVLSDSWIPVPGELIRMTDCFKCFEVPVNVGDIGSVIEFIDIPAKDREDGEAYRLVVCLMNCTVCGLFLDEIERV